MPPTPGQPVKEPMVIPLAIGLVGADGRDMSLSLEDGRAGGARRAHADPAGAELHVQRRRAAAGALAQSRLLGAGQGHVRTSTAADLAFLAAHDSDPFNRWQAVQSLANALLIENVAAIRAGGAPREDEALIAALAAALADPALEPAFVALVLTLPSEADIAREIGRDVDPDAIFAARTRLRARDRTPARTGAARDLPAHAGRRAVQPGRRERRPPRAEERLPRPARGGRSVGDRACGAAIPQRRPT